MKTMKTFAVVILATTILSCDNRGGGQKSLKTEIDSVSYALGLDIASKFKMPESNLEEIDKELFIQGYRNGMDSLNLLIEEKDINTTLRNFFQKRQEERIKKQQAEAAKEAEVTYAEEKKKNAAFLEENKSKKGVQVTPSGLQYQVLKEGKGASPKASSKVKVHYHGTLIDGTVFDSSVDRKQPSEFGVSQVIKGWTEGLQLMKPGAKYKFFIPQELAYGATSRGEHIKPFSTLILDRKSVV